jgi:hypothetical protein
MSRSETKHKQLQGSISKQVDGTARLQAQFASREAEWVDAVSYWLDYMTIIDIPAVPEQGSRQAS